MDNAVKALIIAGAVLIAILLIGVGITIFGSASKPLDQGQKQSSQQAITMFNNNISANLGENLSAATVKTLFTIVKSSNAENVDHQIELTGVDSISKISTKYTYSTEEEYDDEGYIKKITVTKNTK